MVEDFGIIQAMIANEFPPIEILWPVIIFACFFMVFDIISGFVAAAFNHEINSRKMKNGIWHKCGFLLAIIFGIACEYATNFINLGFTIPVQAAICTLIICTEIVSILENLGKISPELAGNKFLKIFDTKEIHDGDMNNNDK